LPLWWAADFFKFGGEDDSMFRKSLLLSCFLILLCSSLSLPVLAQIQGVCGETSNQNKVGCTLPYLYGSSGALPVYQGGRLATAGDVFDFVSNPTALTATLGTELTTLPLSAPGSGFVFQLDRASGLEVRTTQSLGPILAERGDTIGRHKMFVGFSYQYFKFGSEDGIANNSLHNVLQHGQESPLRGEDADLVSTNDAIDLKIHQFAGFVTYGITDRIDISAVIPILNVRFGAYSNATIQNITGPFVHAFCPTPSLANPCLTQSFSNFKDATGIGDLVFRFKARVWGGEHTKLAAGADLRLPTGDEMSFRGSGTYGVRPFVALSYTKDRFSPHANFGFQVNGDSILAGDFTTGTKAHLPNEVTYSVGTDLGITSKFTVAADWLGERVINGFNLRQSSCTETYTGAAGAVCTPGGATGGGGTSYTFPETLSFRASYSMNDIAIGAKISPIKNLLITLNGMFKLDDPGLRAKVVPMVGIGYTF
jgi:hypothetical protein